MVRRAWIPVLAVIAAVPFTAARGAAQVTTDAGASILFFPLVVSDAQHDTLIELANRSTRVLYARCTYTRGGEGGAASELAFDVVLVARQTTHWAASRGRIVDASDPRCSNTPSVLDCDGAGLDPGRIPPVPEEFQGDLICVQLDRSRAPTSGNALRGVATLVDASRDVAKYAAVGLPGAAVNDADDSLCLGGAARENCPRGAEYAACPESWLVSMRAEGLAQSSEPGAPTLRNRFIVTTCSRRAGSGAAVLQILVLSELEQRFTTSVSVQRWAEIALSGRHIFDRDLLGVDFMQVRLRSAAGGPGLVVAAMADRVASDGEPVGGAVAAVPHPEGVRTDPDRIVFQP